jgi:ribonuclease R
VHRILTAAITEEKNGSAKRYASFAVKASKKSSDAELRALEAERSIDDLYKTLYMKNHIGEEFDAVISSVTSFGLFCMLPNTCEGLVPLIQMRGKYWFDPESLTLTCGSHIYRLGDSVRIKVERVDVSRRNVDFSLID